MATFFLKEPFAAAFGKKERHNYKPQQTAKTEQKDSPSSCLRGNFDANTRSQRPKRNKPLKTPLQPKVECLPRACPFMSNPTSTAGQTAQLGPAPTLHDLQPTSTNYASGQPVLYQESSDNCLGDPGKQQTQRHTTHHQTKTSYLIKRREGTKEMGMALPSPATCRQIL